MKCPAASFPQPPLQFYLDVIANQPWSDITVLTYATKEDLINPTYSRLQAMAANGLLGKNVNFYIVGADSRKELCSISL